MSSQNNGPLATPPGTGIVVPNLTPVYLKLLLTMILWGGTFITGRLAVQTVSVFSAAFLRFAIASLLLLIIQHHQKTPKNSSPPFPRGLGGSRLKKNTIGILLMGFTGIFAYNAFFLAGLQILPASRASLIVALNPIAIALASALLFKEPLSKLKITGILTSLVGVSIIISRGNPIDLLKTGIGLGDLFLFGCVASWVSYTLVGKKVLTHVSNLTATTYSCIAGCLMLLPIALHEGLLTNLTHASLTSLLSIAYMGIFGTVLAFLWYADGIRKLGASRTAIFTNLVPTSAVLMGAFGLGEPMTLAIALGGSLVITGVLLTNLPTPESMQSSRS
jgi:drug/metabolite transporter (DMT)-like permease